MRDDSFIKKNSDINPLNNIDNCLKGRPGLTEYGAEIIDRPRITLNQGPYLGPDLSLNSHLLNPYLMPPKLKW